MLRARLAGRLLGWAAARGLDAPALARRCGVPEVAPGDEQLLPLSALRALGGAVSRQLDDPLLGLHLAQRLEATDYGAVGFLARSGGTLGQALELFAAHAGALNSMWSVTLERTAGGMRVHQRIPREPLGLGPVGNLYVVCALVMLARRLSGRPLSPTRAWVAHRGTAPPELEHFLGCPLDFGREENGLEVPASVLALPLATVDPALTSWLQRAVLPAGGEADALARLRSLLRTSLEAPLSLKAAARLVGQSPRSLQRRLADEGTTYHRETDRVRREVASELLAEGLAVKEVAFRCGFSDARSFARAYKRWTGSTPGAPSRGREG